MAGQRRLLRDQLFVIRIWTEHEERASDLWRASVTHVQTRERRYFTNYGELCEFLDRVAVEKP